MTMHVYELWLTSRASRRPFAAVIEDGERCAWTIATDTGGQSDPAWSAAIVDGWGRDAQDAWVLDAWREFLEELVSAPSEVLRVQLQKLDRSTAGIEVSRPRKVSSPLPPRALAYRWRRNRLGDPHDVVAAAISAELGRGGRIHWRASIEINEQCDIPGEWIVENPAERGSLPQNELATPVETSNAPLPAPLKTVAAGLAVVSIVEVEEIDSIKTRWVENKQRLAGAFPFGIAVVRDSRHVELLEHGCIVGARFAAPVSLAVAATRNQWNLARWPGGHVTPPTDRSDPGQR